MLRQTERLVFCDIALGPGLENSLGEINLPHLQTLHVDDYKSKRASSGDLSIFDLINTPVLATLEIRAILLDNSLANFFERSRGIRELSLCQTYIGEALAGITALACQY